MESSTQVSGTSIHPTAIVAKGATLGNGVSIGPYSVIGANVVIGDRTKVAAHVVIEGRTSLGADNQISSFASLGTAPQDLKYGGEPTELVIGDKNSIREYVNISIGTINGGAKTSIGHQNLIMAYTHIAHDVVIGNECIFANGVQLAGHVKVAHKVVFGGMSGGHQFTSFGEYVMVAAGAIVVQDVPPFCMVQGDRASPSGLNVVGLRRAGIKDERLQAIKGMYRLLYQTNLTLEDTLKAIEKEIAPCAERESFLAFIKSSRRGICR